MNRNLMVAELVAFAMEDDSTHYHQYGFSNIVKMVLTGNYPSEFENEVRSWDNCDTAKLSREHAAVFGEE